MSDPKSEPSSSKIEEYERQATTALRQGKRVALRALDEPRMLSLDLEGTKWDLLAAWLYTPRLTPSSTATGKISLDLRST